MMAHFRGYKTFKSQFCRFCRPSAGTFPENPNCADSEKMWHIVKVQGWRPLTDGTWGVDVGLRQMFPRKRHYWLYREQSVAA
jgi:hypothetical protein